MTPRNRADRPLLKKLPYVIKTFSLTEKIIFFVFFFVCIIAGLSLVWDVNAYFLTDMPNRGGTLEEAIVGSPRFINPLLALSDADKDLTSLVYSGLLKATPDGDFINDLSQEYSISPDGLEYTITLKDNIYFHDGVPVTAGDVEFTVKKAQDSMLKSPKRINWEGITVEKINDKQIKFILKRPYSPFIENLTLGILPEHIWRNLDSDQFAASLFNTEPIGSGPYKVKKVKRNSGGLPVLYQLAPFDRYALGAPYIANITLRFYSNEEDAIEAYEDGEVEGVNGVPPQKVSDIQNDNTRVEQSSLPRVFGVFFNQNQAPLFVNREVRVALNVAVDKERIVNEVLNGFGTTIDAPLSIENEAAQSATRDTASSTTPVSDTSSSTTPAVLSHTEQAIAILQRNGWALNAETGVMEKKTKTDTLKLEFSISTGNATELKQTAIILKDEWQKIGAKVDVKVFETSDLNQEIIRPRKYDALLFGEVTGRDFDLYPFWHSSQRNDPGLNVAMYANIKADKLLEEMRATTDRSVKEEKYKSFEQLIQEDVPAIFLYSPDFIYFVPESVKNLALGKITAPAERFMNIYEWYIETNKVWKIFVKN